MRARKLLKPLHLSMVAIGLLLSSCAQFESARNTDLAIDTYAPSAKALGVAESRAGSLRSVVAATA
jgi:hypothetical protein